MCIYQASKTTLGGAAAVLSAGSKQLSSPGCFVTICGNTLLAVEEELTAANDLWAFFQTYSVFCWSHHNMAGARQPQVKALASFVFEKESYVNRKQMVRIFGTARSSFDALLLLFMRR